jgi:DNA (cytosine-5)-methyltransferase 1
VKFGSVCSGVEAASLAWEPLGWAPQFFAEIEKFPSAVLAHRWPDVPNLGDLTKIDGDEWRGLIDVLVAGTPCQAFSVAGLRRGLHDDRGNITLAFVELLHAIDPWCSVWENVPGVLSDKTNAFGCFLAGLVGSDAPLVPRTGQRWTDAGMVVGPARSAAWRTLDAQYLHLAQRRERVFVVSFRTRDGLNPGAVLFEPEGVRRDSPPSREAGERVAGTLAPGAHAGGFNGRDAESGQLVARAVQEDNQNGVRLSDIAGSVRADAPGSQHGGTLALVPDTCPALKARDGKGPSSDGDGDGAILVPVAYTVHAAFSTAMTGNGDAKAAFPTEVARALDSSGGFATNQGGTVVAEPLPFDTTQVTSKPNRSNPRPGDPSHPLAAGAHPLAAGAHPPAIAFDARQSGPLDTDGHSIGILAPSLTTNDPSRSPQASEVTDQVAAVHAASMAVRRLTPRECERLQGMPDDHTRIPWRGQPDESCPDGPRYRAIGNSMAVNVMAWIGRRIDLLAAHYEEGSR